MLRASLYLLRGSNQYPWSSKNLAAHRKTQFIRAHRKEKAQEYKDGLMRGDEIFGVKVDQKVMRKDLRQNGVYGVHQSEQHSRQQAYLNTRDYQSRQLKRLGSGDRSSEKVQRLNSYHFPMLK